LLITPGRFLAFAALFQFVPADTRQLLRVLSGTFGAELPSLRITGRCSVYASLVYAVVVALSFITLQCAGRGSLAACAANRRRHRGLSVLSYASWRDTKPYRAAAADLAGCGRIDQSRQDHAVLPPRLASIAALLEHSFAVLYDDARWRSMFRSALLCVSYLQWPWLALRWEICGGQPAAAQRRGQDLASMWRRIVW